MAEKHTVHLKTGGKVVIDGDRVELHLPGPLIFRREHWVKYLLPREEARRAFTYARREYEITQMLEEAFSAVPMTVYPEAE